jgi:hypothetical protein
MDNPFDEMRSAVLRAREVNRAVDAQVNDLIDLIDGRLENATGYRLERLKKQLQRFNAKTHQWKA